MPHISLDNALGPHPQALQLRSARAELLATNLANGDTPGYQARDIDFASVMRDTMDGGAMRKTNSTPHPRHMHLGGSDRPGGAGDPSYRVPLMPAIDGNTVDTELEQAEMARNNLQIMASIQFLSGRFRGMLTAIRGE